METKNMIGGIVSLAVVVICVAAIMMPVLNDATTTEATFTNEGMFNMTALTETSEHVMSFDYTDPGIITVDDVDIDMTDVETTYGSVTALFSNDWFVRYVLSTGFILYSCNSSDTPAGTTIGSVDSELSCTITISAGTATIVYGETTVEKTVSGAGLILQSEASDYVLKTSTDTAYVNGDSIIYGVGRTDRALGTAGTSFNTIIKVTVDDGVEPLYYTPAYTWNDNRTVDATANETYVDLYELTGFSFNLVSDDVEHEVTYNMIFVPTEVTSELAQHLDSGEIALLNAVPVLIIVSIVVAAVGLAITSRRD